MAFKKILIFSAVVSILCSLSNADVTKGDIDKAIDKGILKHPYLYFTESEKPAILERIKNDPECNDIMRRLIAEANRLLYMPVEKMIPIEGRNTRGGWSEYDRDGKYEKYYYSNRDNAVTLAFVYQMTGEKKYAEKAYEFADAFCDLPTWVIRAHEFPIIYSRIMPWGVNDDQVNFNFDHVTGDSGRLYAAVYDWLYPALTEAQRDRIRGALIEKVVTRVRGDWEYHWWAWAYRCNWCGVCCSGVGLTGLALLTEDPQLTDVVAESYNRIDNMLNELGVDGGWQEGGGYWNYAIHTSSFFADALKRLTQGKYNLFENERLKSNPVAFPLFISVPPNGSLNFEDSGSSTIGSTELINKLATETKNPTAAWYRQEFFGTGSGMFDIIWPRPTVKPDPPDILSRHFRTIDWWVMRSDFKDTEKVLVAGKAGKNDDPHHGHLDCGHFIVSWRGEFYIRDIGSGPYDEKYFDDARWDYPQASSVGHNVVFVNGEKQLSGKMRKQPWNYNIGGKVIEFKTTKERDYVLMDPTNAYPGKELKGWRRHIILDKPVITVIVDEVQSQPGAEIAVRFHSACTTDIKNGFVMITGKSGKMALIPCSDGEVKLRPGQHISLAIQYQSSVNWIPYIDSVVSAKDSRTVIGTIILPVENENDAQEITKSVSRTLDSTGNLTLSFVKGGKTYTYNYKNIKEKGGLIFLQ